MNNLIIEQNKKLAFMSAFFLALCIFLGYVVSRGFFSIDQAVQDSVVSLRNDFLSSIFIIITNIASPLFLQIYSIAMFLFLVCLNRLHESVNFVVSMFAGMVSFFAVKSLFEISRPLDKITNATGWGFPSGHTTLATIAFLLTIYFCKDLIKKDAYRKIFVEFFALIIALIAVSRIYLGAHFLSDVIGGFFLGLAIVLISVIFARTK